MGSSQNGMRSLETRVHGLELALDEISYDLAVSSGRITKFDAPKHTCCMLPGAEFLSSKFWKKTQGRYSSYRFSRTGSTPLLPSSHYRANRNAESIARKHNSGYFSTSSLDKQLLSESWNVSEHVMNFEKLSKGHNHDELVSTKDGYLKGLESCGKLCFVVNGMSKGCFFSLKEIKDVTAKILNCLFLELCYQITYFLI